VNYAFLKKLEEEHISAGYGYNSLSVKLRTIRAIYNKAINEEIAKPEWYPFNKYKIKETKTQKRAIAKEDILKIENYKPEFGSQEFHARNYFLFSFYMIGMNFTDIAYLKYSNIKNNRLEYYRKKTGRFYSLELYDKPKAIIEIYKKNNFVFTPDKKKDRYIFPIISREKPEDIRADIYNGLRLLNKYIRRIALKLDIDAHLTSYVARHSWASIGKALNIPLAVISDGLGHEDLSTTQVYLDELDKSTIDQASKLITG
jgi:integrase